VLDPGGGDTTYLQTLAAHPPPGVSYELYPEAMARGALVQHGTRGSLRRALSERRNVLGEALTIAANKPIHMLRSRKVLFNEPFRFYEVKAGEYDMVHMHIFSAHFNALDCPLVCSNGGALRHLYLDARGYSMPRVRNLERADRVLGRLLRVEVSGEVLKKAARAYTFTRSGTRELRRRRLLDPSRIDYIPFYLPPPPPEQIRAPGPEHVPRRVGFVARDFKAKGGEAVLEAWKIVVRARPDAELVIAGSPPPPPERHPPGVTWLPYIPREELLGDLMPSLDVFAYPTLYDYLPCYTQVEALARGVPVAGSTHRDFAESIGGERGSLEGSAGLLCAKNDSRALASNILKMLEPEANRRFSHGARELFAQNYAAMSCCPRSASSTRLPSPLLIDLPISASARTLEPEVKVRIDEMNIALFASAFYPHVGGVEELVRQLAREYIRRGDHAIVLTNRWPRDLPAHEEFEGIPLYRLPMRAPEGSVKAIANYHLTHRAIETDVATILRRHKSEIVHVQCVSSNGHYARLAARALKLPLVVTSQGERTMDATGVYERSAFLNRTLRALLKEGDALSACSRDTLEDLERYMGEPFGERARVIYNGIAADDFNDEAAPHQHPRPYILGIGRWVPQKGFDVLLRAFALAARDEAFEHDLLLAGEGEERATYEAIVREEKLEGRVHLLGRAARPMAVSLFKGASFFVLPSRHEPFGIVNIEAMTAGKAVVASRVGGVPEIVRDNENGLLVAGDNVEDLARALKRLAGDEELRDRLGRTGASSRAPSPGPRSPRSTWKCTSAPWQPLQQVLPLRGAEDALKYLRAALLRERAHRRWPGR
jgi:glycosyltransferase involved in cell wall biosynthesis